MSDAKCAQIHTFSKTMDPLGQVVLSIGVFDGVHAGHQALIDGMIVDASFRGLPAVVVTFDPDPDEIIDGITPAPKLMTHEQRIKALACTGVDHVVVVPFSDKIARLSPEKFLDEVVLTIGQPRAIHVGEDFHFGYKAAGGIRELCAWGQKHQCQILAYPLFDMGGTVVTATTIRGLLEKGDVSLATQLLGVPYSITGEVVHGRGEGRNLEFPTVNIKFPAGLVCPKDGVYAGRAYLASKEKPYKAAIHIGPVPTYGIETRTVEAHLLAFDGDLYGETVRLEFVEWISALKAYGSLAELKGALKSFVETTDTTISL